MTKTAILAKAALIRLAIFDVDGVLTNGNICINDNGEEYKLFYVQDGLGIKLLQQSGVTVAIISSRESKAVAHRLHDLGVTHVYQGQADKKPALAKLQKELKLGLEQIAYTGDDLPDLPLIRSVGLGIAVANAHPFILRYAIWQTQATGGKGAAREVCDLIMQAHGTLDKAYANYL